MVEWVAAGGAENRMHVIPHTRMRAIGSYPVTNPHVFFGFFLLECVCGCMCVHMCMYVCVGAGVWVWVWVCGREAGGRGGDLKD